MFYPSKWSLPISTSWLNPEASTKWLTSCKRQIQMHFLETIILNFDRISTLCSWGRIDNKAVLVQTTASWLNPEASTKWLTSCKRQIQMHFLETIILNFDRISRLCSWGRIDNKAVLVQTTAWRRTRDKVLPKSRSAEMYDVIWSH